MAKRSVLRRMTRLAVGAAAMGTAVWALREIPTQMGAAATGARAERMHGSPQWRDGKFRNSVPSSTVPNGRSILSEMRGEHQRKPTRPIPVLTPTGPHPSSGLHITWYGHASALVEIDGRRV